MSQSGDQIGISGNAFARGVPAMTLTWVGPSGTSRSATIFNHFTKGYNRDVNQVHDSEGNWKRETHKNDRIELSAEAKLTGAKQSDARAVAADPPIKGQTATISGATDGTLNSGYWIVSEKPDVSQTPEGEALMVIQLHAFIDTSTGNPFVIVNLGGNRIGIDSPTLIHDEINQNTRTGSDFAQTFRGTLSEMRARRASANASGAGQTKITPVGDGEYELTVMFPYDENGIESVPLPSIHELEVDVAQSPWTTNTKLLTDLTVSQVLELRKIIEDYIAGKYDTTAVGETAQGNAEVDADDVSVYGVEIFRLVAGMGADSFIEYSSVYRRTLTAATAPQVAAARTGEGKIWTTAEVIAQEGLDNSFFNLDTNSQWLKGRCQVVSVAGQKTQVTYSYTETFKASRRYYDAFGSASLFNAAA